MDHVYRRRDVRDLCERVFDVLGVQLDDRAEFDRDFLTGVRDFMREGVRFEDAVLTFEVPQPQRTPNVSLSEQPEDAPTWYDSNLWLIAHAHRPEMSFPNLPETEGATRAPEELTPAANMARATAPKQS